MKIEIDASCSLSTQANTKFNHSDTSKSNDSDSLSDTSKSNYSEDEISISNSEFDCDSRFAFLMTPSKDKEIRESKVKAVSEILLSMGLETYLESVVGGGKN